MFFSSDVQAHGVLEADSYIEYSSDQLGEAAHCHGAAECVVTVFLETVSNRNAAKKLKSQYILVTKSTLIGLNSGREPPIPIIFF